MSYSALACIQSFNVVKGWVVWYGLIVDDLVLAATRDGRSYTLSKHRIVRRRVGMVDVVLRTSMSSRYQTLAGTYHPYASSDPDSGAFQ